MSDDGNEAHAGPGNWNFHQVAWVQAWNFGDQLAMIFLAGVPVADFALRLRKEYDASRPSAVPHPSHVPAFCWPRIVFVRGARHGSSAPETRVRWCR